MECLAFTYVSLSDILQSLLPFNPSPSLCLLRFLLSWNDSCNFWPAPFSCSSFSSPLLPSLTGNKVVMIPKSGQQGEAM